MPEAAAADGAPLAELEARGAAVPSTWARRLAGTAGPILTPATRGQAIPTTKPTTPMIPTRDHTG